MSKSNTSTPNSGETFTSPRQSFRNLRTVIAACCISVFVLSVGLATGASAHTGDATYVYLDVTSSSLQGRIEAPIPDVFTAIEVPAPEKAQALTAIGQNEAAIKDYFNEHFSIGPADQSSSWDIDFDDAALFFSEEAEIDDNYMVIPFTVEVTGEAVPREFSMEFDPFVDEIEGRDALLLIGNDWEAGVIDNGWEQLTRYDANSRQQIVDLGDTSWVKNFTSSIKLGLNHIQTGPDHILFVLVLLLPSVLVLSGRQWQPTTSFGSSLWRVLKIVSMFTIAHSITFTLAGLDIIPLPSSKIVEFIIALSIAAAALHNIRPILANREWVLAFVFGLFHGMGFASLVEGLDVARSTQLVSLLGRNVGIEIGQAFVVLFFFPALYMFRRTRFYRPFLVGASLLLALISLLWMIERLAEVDLGINGILEPVLGWPQVVVVAAAAFAAATAAYFKELKGEQLLPTYSEEATPSEPGREKVGASG